MTKTTETWEKRFDGEVDRLVALSLRDKDCKPLTELKSFIRAEIELARQEGERTRREKTLIQCAALAEYEGSFDSRAYENNKRDKFAQGAATASANIALKIKALTNPNH